MTTANMFSRQSDAGSRTRTTYSSQNLKVSISQGNQSCRREMSAVS